MIPLFSTAAQTLLDALRRRRALIRARSDAGVSSIEAVIIIGALAILAVTIVAWISHLVVAKVHTINLG